jgi:hypothetical protein
VLGVVGKTNTKYRLEPFRNVAAGVACTSHCVLNRRYCSWKPYLILLLATGRQMRLVLGNFTD